jgi:hypothetical protein
MRKTAVGVGYLSVNMLRLWHSTIDCASFGLLSEVPLEVSVLPPGLVALVVEVEAVAKMPEVGLPKQHKLQGGCLHTLECKANGTKQYA